MFTSLLTSSIVIVVVILDDIHLQDVNFTASKISGLSTNCSLKINLFLALQIAHVVENNIICPTSLEDSHQPEDL